jgi:hypothetical protein
MDTDADHTAGLTNVTREENMNEVLEHQLESVKFLVRHPRRWSQKEYVVDITVHLSDDSFGSKDEWTKINEIADNIVADYRGLHQGAGTGAGCRDIQIVFRSRQVAEMVVLDAINTYEEEGFQAEAGIYMQRGYSSTE